MKACMRACASAALAVVLSGTVAGAEPAAKPLVLDFAVERGAVPPWPDTVATLGNGVRVHENLIFKQVTHHRPLRLDVYVPPQAGDSRLPLLVHVHGGAWRVGGKRSQGPVRRFPEVLAQFAERGFVVASVEYRLDGEETFPASIEDVRDAIRFLRQRSGRFGFDPARVGVFGGSAGGQLAALAATACGAQAFPGYAEDADGAAACVQAAVAWYGVYDFNTIPNKRGPEPYLGCDPEAGCSREVKAFASPATYVDANDPPILLISGLADKVVVVSQQHEFEAALKQAGVDVSAIYREHVDHGFVGRTPEETRRESNLAFAETMAFFAEKLR